MGSGSEFADSARNSTTSGYGSMPESCRASMLQGMDSVRGSMMHDRGSLSMMSAIPDHGPLHFPHALHHPPPLEAHYPTLHEHEGDVQTLAALLDQNRQLIQEL